MSDDQSQIRRLRDDLDELLSKDEKVFGFGIISTQPRRAVENPKFWKEVGKLISPKRVGADAYVLERRPIQFEPFPDGFACVRWWGDPEAVQSFKQWAGRASDMLLKAGILPNETRLVQPTSPGLRLALPDLLSQNSRPFRLIEELVAAAKRTSPDQLHSVRLDVGTIWSSDQQRKLRVPAIRQKPVAFVFDGLPAASIVAIKAFESLCELRGGPRLRIERRERTIILDGKAYVLPDEHYLVFESIFAGGGAVVSRSAMRKRHKLLKDDEHLDRKIDNLKKTWPKLYKTIKRVPRIGYEIRKQYVE